MLALTGKKKLSLVDVNLEEFVSIFRLIRRTFLKDISTLMNQFHCIVKGKKIDKPSHIFFFTQNLGPNPSQETKLE